MIQTSIPRCDCCGLPVGQGFGEDCPRCNYPLSLSREERFLASALRDLHRVFTYGGANLTVAGLLRRYQVRLDYLNRLKRTMTPASTSIQSVVPAPPPVPPVAPVGGLSKVVLTSPPASPYEPAQLPYLPRVEAAPINPPVGRPPVVAPVREGPNLRQPLSVCSPSFIQSSLRSRCRCLATQLIT